MTLDELERIRRRKLEQLRKKLERPRPAINHPIEITDENFERVIKQYPMVVVDFWAEWCAPCLMLAPTLDALAREYAGKVVFGKLNVDENRQTAAKYGIMSIPTLLFFKQGRLVDRVIGAVPKQIIEQRLRRLVQTR